MLVGALPPALTQQRALGQPQADEHSGWRPVVLPVWLWVGLGATAGLILAVRFAHSSALPAYLAFAMCAALLCAADLASARIPDRILGPAGGAVLICFGAASAAGGGAGPLVRALLAALVVGSGFFVLALLAGGGFGLGDVKLLAFLAVLEGYQSWKTAIYGPFIGLAVAAVAGLAARGARHSTQIPLAPWLILGALAALAV
jgi:leader peptidase (prepilin peptidase)/N-methyltransferase